MILAKAVSAAMKTLQNSTDAQLAEAGIDRTTYALYVMKQIEAEFAKKDANVLCNLPSSRKSQYDCFRSR